MLMAKGGESRTRQRSRVCWDHGGNSHSQTDQCTVPFAFTHQSGMSRGQQPKQRDPDFPLHLGQLVQGYPKAFPGQLRNIVPRVCPGSSSRPPPGGPRRPIYPS
ncbi:hypothetical protein CHARACLAT_030645 [Characodon lateralis]|uniref:Uncharacterized protein n=1 Tax=Characodon lateralis TaxID=208331 RepID=A0ABU7EY51_9TELE|nr:hypothetical protein [Characodon lateralis]